MGKFREWESIHGIPCYIRKYNLRGGKYRFAGFATFPTHLHEDLHEDVRVHGLITSETTRIATDGQITVTYGFDCNHRGDTKPDSPTQDIEWVQVETERMVDSILQLQKLQYVLIQAEKQVESAMDWIRRQISK